MRLIGERLLALRRRDLAALLLAGATVLAGMTVWLLGSVDLGLELGQDGDGFVRVTEVTPGSFAASQGFFEGAILVDLQRRDGSMAGTGASDSEIPGTLGGDRLRFVTELLPADEIDYLYAVNLDSESPPEYEWGMSLGRSQLTSRLDGGGMLLLVGVVLGGITAGLLARGWFGARWAGEGAVLAGAIVTPLAALPLLYGGSPIGSAAALALPALAMLPLSWSLSESLTSPIWADRLRLFAVGAALLVVLLVGRFQLSAEGVDLRRDPLLLVAAIPLATSVATGLAGERTTGERFQILALGALPAAAVLVQLGAHPELLPLVLVVGAVFAWRLTPAWVTARLAFLKPATSPQPLPAADAVEEAEPEEPAAQARRDLAALLIAALTFLAGLMTCCETWSVAAGALFGALVAFTLQRGLMGPGWARAAIPLACAIGVPIMALSFGGGGLTQDTLRLMLPAASALPVAHLLGSRHPDLAWRRALFGGSLALVALVALILLGSAYGGPVDGPYALIDGGSRASVYLALGFVALLPGLGSALARSDDRALPISRLDLVAIGLTPGAAMTMLPGYSANIWPLALWLAALVAWRRFTIAPLLGLAQRTQRQRDLAVAAVEAERARLAADLHDDALQELTALVRRLDSAGDAEGAELARSVAERLRVITSDLRLPLLDDLGAGPALEWLVGRFRPLTEGEVRLERTDPQRPPAGVELAVFRVAQEALANAVKHGKPPITVRYRVDEAGGVSLSVDDEGPGIAPDAAEVALRAGHLGVANMQQRAQQIGALLDIRRWPGGGTHVALEWRPQ